MASSYIPVNVMFDILARLPAKSLLRFKCVCKEWYNLINSSPFIQHHLTKSMEIDSHLHDSLFIFTQGEFLYLGENIESPSQVVKLNLVPKNCISSDIRVIGTCNGLVCLEIGNNKGFIIFNPLTCIFKPVHCNCPVMKYYNRCMEYGFGYDSQNVDYEIVVIMLGEVRDIWIYSLNSNSWRTMTTTCSQLPHNCLDLYLSKKSFMFLNALVCIEMQRIFGVAPIYTSFGGVSLLSAMFCYTFIIETKGRSLEEIEMSLRSKLPGHDN